MNFTVERARRERLSPVCEYLAAISWLSEGHRLGCLYRYTSTYISKSAGGRRRKGGEGTNKRGRKRATTGRGGKGRDGTQQHGIAWKRREGQGKVVADRRQEEKGERNAKEQRCTRARVKGREVRITGEGGRQRRRSRWKKGRKREDKRMRGQTGLQAVGRR